MRFHVIDHIRDGGSSDNTASNDDWIGFDDRVAAVADGATGLGDARLVSEADSDAQWIAKAAVEHFLGARADDPVRELVREFNSRAREIIGQNINLQSVPRFAWPAASFIMARLQNGMLEISGLGDCSAFVEMKDGYLDRFAALNVGDGSESAAAKKDLADRPASRSGIRTPEVLASLRAKRALQNTRKSGVWTLGLAPEAGDEVFTVALPIHEIKSVLLASDGFSAATDDYKLYSPYTFLDGARQKGLKYINSEIRRVERIKDPDASLYPRYKQSDDSSAILLEIRK